MIKWIYLAVIVLLSALAYIAYAADKKKAIRGARRIPEKTLLCLSFFGGAIGGYAAMFVCRHKTKKWYFHLVNLSGLLWQILAAIALFIR